jgi:hypothetical protein
VAARGSLEHSTCAVVTGGWDTDSNAAVGSVTGAPIGAANLPARWVQPLGGYVPSSIAGFDGIGFVELAERTRRLAADPPEREGRS